MERCDWASTINYTIAMLPIPLSVILNAFCSELIILHTLAL